MELSEEQLGLRYQVCPSFRVLYRLQKNDLKTTSRFVIQGSTLNSPLASFLFVVIYKRCEMSYYYRRRRFPYIKLLQKELLEPSTESMMSSTQS